MKGFNYWNGSKEQNVYCLILAVKYISQIMMLKTVGWNSLSACLNHILLTKNFGCWCQKIKIAWKFSYFQPIRNRQMLAMEIYTWDSIEIM